CILQPISTGLPALVDVAGELSCPWLGIFADRDARITADEVDKLRESAEGSEAVSEVVRLAGADNRFDTDPDSAEQAWHRTVNWFDSHLR
ncbi:MAG: dienelactone hydrolase family protein, partial [Sciscionella sp.]